MRYRSAKALVAVGALLTSLGVLLSPTPASAEVAQAPPVIFVEMDSGPVPIFNGQPNEYNGAIQQLVVPSDADHNCQHGESTSDGLFGADPPTDDAAHGAYNSGGCVTVQLQTSHGNISIPVATGPAGLTGGAELYDGAVDSRVMRIMGTPEEVNASLMLLTYDPDQGFESTEDLFTGSAAFHEEIVVIMKDGHGRNLPGPDDTQDPYPDDDNEIFEVGIRVEEPNDGPTLTHDVTSPVEVAAGASPIDIVDLDPSGDPPEDPAGDSDFDLTDPDADSDELDDYVLMVIWLEGGNEEALLDLSPVGQTWCLNSPDQILTIGVCPELGINQLEGVIPNDELAAAATPILEAIEALLPSDVDSSNFAKEADGDSVDTPSRAFAFLADTGADGIDGDGNDGNEADNVLDFMTFTPPPTGDHDITVNFFVTDLGNNGLPFAPGPSPFLPIPDLGFATESFDIQVRDADDDPPTIVAVPPTQQVNEGDTANFEFDVDDTDSDELTITAFTDDCGGVTGAPSTGVPSTIDAVNADLSGLSITAPGVVECTVTATVSDGVNEPVSATATFEIELDDPPPVNLPPTVTAVPPDQTVDEGQTANLAFTVSDPENDGLQLTALGGTCGAVSGGPSLPATGTGAELTDLLDTLSVTAPDLPSCTVTATVEDPTNPEVTGTHTVTINQDDPPVNDPPEISVDPTSFTVEIDETANLGDFTVTDDDAEDDDLTVTLSIVAGNTGDGTFSPPGPFDGEDAAALSTTLDGITFTPTVLGPLTARATVVDAESGESDTADVIISVIPDSDEPPTNQPPTVIPVPPDQTVDEGQTANLAFTVSDPDGDGLQLTALGGTCGAVSGGPSLPATGTGAELTDLLDTLSVTAPDLPSCTVTATVEDPTNPEVTGTHTVTINQDDPPGNQPPVVTAVPPAQTVTEGDTADFAFTVSDIDDAQLTLTALGGTCGAVAGGPSIPANGTGAELTNQLATLSITAPALASCTVTATVEDPTNPEVSATHTVNIDEDTPANDPPSIVAVPPTQTVDEGQSASFAFDVNDPEDDDLQLTALASTCGTVTGAPVLPVTGSEAVIDGALDDLSITAPALPSCTVTATVEDPTNPEVSATHTVTIDAGDPDPENQAPTVSVTSPVSVEVNGSIAFTDALAVVLADADNVPADPYTLTVTITGAGQVSAAVVPGDTVGTLAELQTLVAGLVFNAGPTAGSAQIVITLDDGTDTGTGTIDIEVTEAQDPGGSTTTTTSSTLPGGGVSTSTTAGPDVGGVGGSRGGGSTLPRTGADLLTMAGIALVLLGTGTLVGERRRRIAVPR